jgi:FtsP/CotA-like multicopper oxidase with cupredoxin domain
MTGKAVSPNMAAVEALAGVLTSINRTMYNNTNSYTGDKIMNRKIFKSMILGMAVGYVSLVCSPQVQAMIPGVTGVTTFNFTAKTGYIYTGEGGSYLMWGYALDPNEMQYPGPTIIVNQGETITINLTNTLTVPVSMVFPGQSGVTASGGSSGLLTREAAPGGGTVSYTFTVSQPGTYLYHSGTNPELQIEMGLVGALIVRPAGFDHMMPTAYEHMDSMYDREFLVLETEIDHRIHEQVEQGMMSQIDNTTWFPFYWFINGRNAPDTMLDAFVPWLPNQPYNCMPMMHPGDKVLMRVISAGRDPHPFHTHGNNFTIIARDGRLLQSVAGAGTDLAVSNFTITVPVGGTADFIFTWTGEKLGWDMYGHAPGDPMEPGEYAPDHGKPFPVVLPSIQQVTGGAMWSGSPFLGALGALPPGEGGLNPNGGYTYMWHSHAEKEMTNNDIFPGGLMTMLIIEAPSVVIPEH